MAIDTRDKRASALRVPLPAPDGDLASVGDKVQATWNYRGLVTSVTSVVMFPGDTSWADTNLGDTTWTDSSLGDTTWTDSSLGDTTWTDRVG